MQHPWLQQLVLALPRLYGKSVMVLIVHTRGIIYYSCTAAVCVNTKFGCGEEYSNHSWISRGFTVLTAIPPRFESTTCLLLRKQYGLLPVHPTRWNSHIPAVLILSADRRYEHVLCTADLSDLPGYTGMHFRWNHALRWYQYIGNCTWAE